MLTSDDLQAIKEIVKDEVAPVKNRLDTLELKVEAINNKIDESQKDTIQVLTDLMHTGYNMHEERIKKLEDQITSQAQ